MNYFSFILKSSLKTSVIFAMFFFSTFSTHGAVLELSAPLHVFDHRQPYIVEVMIDTEVNILSGVGGELSFSSQFFDIESILIKDSVVPLWVTPPQVSKEMYFDGRTHIIFEGIFPGGFGGVKSAYYRGNKKGSLFFLVLIPKKEGKGSFVLDSIVLHEFSGEAKSLPAKTISRDFFVPLQKIPYEKKATNEKEISGSALEVDVSRSELVQNNAWYVSVKSGASFGSPQGIFLQETNTSNVYDLNNSTWKEIASPHVLFYQERNKYIHIKVVYANGMFAYTTVPPVENSDSISYISRILVSVLFCLLVLYFYGYFIYTNKKSSSNIT